MRTNVSFTWGTTPIDVIGEHFDGFGGFSWDLRGEDSEIAGIVGAYDHDETSLEGFLTILVLFRDFDYSEHADLRFAGESLRTGMLEVIGIEEV